MADTEFGKYRLIAELGHGGMADVFLAVARGPVGFNKLLVIKRLRANLAEDPEFVAMLVDAESTRASGAPTVAVSEAPCVANSCAAREVLRAASRRPSPCRRNASYSPQHSFTSSIDSVGWTSAPSGFWYTA